MVVKLRIKKIINFSIKVVLKTLIFLGIVIIVTWIYYISYQYIFPIFEATIIKLKPK